MNRACFQVNLIFKGLWRGRSFVFITGLSLSDIASESVVMSQK